MKDIARIGGVSYTTVSLTLSGKGDKYKIKKETQEKIIKIARDLGYKGNIYASYLRKGKSDFVGIIGSTYNVPIRHLRQNLIAEKLKRIGFNIIIQDFHWRSDGYISIVEEVLKFKPVGLIISEAEDLNLKFYLENIKKRIPVILIDGPEYDTFDQIRINREKIPYLAIHHLWERGYKDIYFTIPSSPLKNNYWAIKERYDGFKRGFYEIYGNVKNIEKKLLWIEKEELSSYMLGYRIAEKYLKKFKKDTGIIALNDHIAIGIIKKLFEENKKIPEDIGIVGSENLPEGEFSIVPLTTISFSINEIVERVVEIFLKRINGEKEKIYKIKIEPEIIIRKSTERR